VNKLLRGIRLDVIFLILIAMSLGAFGQLFMKMGMQNVGQVSVEQIITEKLTQIATEKFVIIGILLYVVSLGIWLAVLSRAELSFAYPLIGLSYAIVAALSVIFLGEHLNAFRIFGIAMIITGVFFVIRFG
jgi:multidrug transporter EmrE-like cation transporter